MKIKLHTTFLDYLNDQPSLVNFIRVKCDTPLIITRFFKIGDSTIKVEIEPDDKIKDIIAKLPKNKYQNTDYSLYMNCDGEKKRIKKHKKFTDYCFLSDDTILVKIKSKYELISKNNKLKSKIIHKNRIIEELNEENKLLKEENLNLKKIEIIKESQKKY